MKLDVCFQESNSAFPVTFIEDDATLEVKFESLQILHIHDADYYEGSTFIIPDFNGKLLPTAEKRLRTDVIVAEISVNYTTNISGGYTVNIGA